MKLLQLKYFRAVARLEHMSKAADKLHIAQPALSITISRLEEDLGVQLFDRRGRRIRLNSYGKIFLSKVEDALDTLEEGRRELADRSGLEHGHLFLDNVTISHISELLQPFLSQHSEVNFNVNQVSSKKIQRDFLNEGKIDFCIRCSYDKQSGIKSHPLKKEEILLGIPPMHRLANRNSIDLNEVANESFIGFKEHTQFREITDEACQKAGFTPNVIFEMDNLKSVRELVQSGLGIAFLPAKDKQKEKSLTLLHIDKPVCERTFRLEWLENRYLSRAARELRDKVIQYYS